MRTALSPHHDDDHGGAAGRLAAGVGYRHGRRITPPAGVDDCRRPDCQPGSDTIYDPGSLFVYGSATAARGTEVTAPGVADLAKSEFSRLKNGSAGILPAS